MSRLAFVLLAAGAFACTSSTSGSTSTRTRTPGSSASIAIGPRTSVSAVGCVGMTVSDLDRSVDFYADVLSFARPARIDVAEGERYAALEGVPGLRSRIAQMMLGTECLVLTEVVAPRGRPVPADSRSNDRSFQHVAIVVSDMDAAYQVLERHRVEHVSPAPQTLPAWNPNAGGIKAFYFKDPDHHVLEVIAFPRGKGDPRWQASGSALFRGIDHTAIVTGDTGASLAFYETQLGFRVAGTSENWGVEQEHLNNVAGAHLRITSLRAGAGPGIELLEYLAPRDGRPIPADARPNDLTHWQTSLVARDIDRPALVRDPDGHALELVPTSPRRNGEAP